MRVVNVVKRVDGVQGSRYLLELEVKDVHGRLLRLSHYIYTLFHYSRNRNRDFDPLQPQGQLMLCNPVGFRWNPAATVHFIVPGMSCPKLPHYIFFMLSWLLFEVLLFKKIHQVFSTPNIFPLLCISGMGLKSHVNKRFAPY